MTTKNGFFIQGSEVLLIESGHGSLGTQMLSHDGPMTKAEAQELFNQDGNEVRAFRFDPEDLNVENVTEDLVIQVVDHAPDLSWDRHVKACQATNLYI